jgi:hypothetical protein
MYSIGLEIPNDWPGLEGSAPTALFQLIATGGIFLNGRSSHPNSLFPKLAVLLNFKNFASEYLKLNYMRKFRGKNINRNSVKDYLSPPN